MTDKTWIHGPPRLVICANLRYNHGIHITVVKRPHGYRRPSLNLHQYHSRASLTLYKGQLWPSFALRRADGLCALTLQAQPRTSLARS
jgi:hypothetical protein